MDTPMPNINVGLMGHVDSGKTSLARALSAVASTAAFDKNPQSQERGITLDLGFSSAVISKSSSEGADTQLQLTFVDCPGHASLIRTVIGGAQIIDLVLLVVDVVKGFQAQTAECLLIAEIFCSQLIVVLNKTDLLPDSDRAERIEKMKQRVSKLFADSKFQNAVIVSCAAAPGSDNTASASVKDVLDAIASQVRPRNRGAASKNMLAAVDHCFTVRGHGTVLTGTILQGSLAIGDSVEILPQGLVKKVKSMQVFRRPVKSVGAGDRVGICVAGLDAELVERAILTTPSMLSASYAAIVSLSRIKYYKNAILSKSHLHITVAYETTLARLTLFSVPGQADFNYATDYRYEAEYAAPSLTAEAGAASAQPEKKSWFAILEFERPILCPPGFLALGAKMDAEPEARQCRFAFYANVAVCCGDQNYRTSELTKLKIFKEKCKRGTIERAVDRYNVIVRNLFKRDSNIAAFAGMRVDLSSGETGMIDGPFGQTGKVKIRISEGLKDETFALLQAKSKGTAKQAVEDQPEPSDGQATSSSNSISVILKFRRYVFDAEKRNVQPKL